MSTDVVKLKFQKIATDREDVIGTLSINRPESANAFSPDVINGLISALTEVEKNRNCRVLIINGAGKHFSAGADLNWMKDAAKLTHQENLKDASKLTSLFEKISNLTLPTIAIVNGAAFGGAVGIVACCDIGIALTGAKFCLSEVKLGILPAVILPYLARKIQPGQLRRLALSAKVFSAQEAADFGLCQLSVDKEKLNPLLAEEINNLLTAGPYAQLQLKNLFRKVQENSLAQGSYTAEYIATARVGTEAQSGLNAFFKKEKTPWFIQLEKDWKFDA